MQYDISRRNNAHLALVLLLIIYQTFFPLFFTGLATADDLHYYLISRQGLVMQDTSYFADVSGRFYYYIVKPVYNLPYLIDNPLFTKFFQVVPILMCVWIFAKIVEHLTKSRELSLLYLLLFLVTLQLSSHTSLFVAYPFYFSFSFFLLLSSVFFLLRFYESLRTRCLLCSVLLCGMVHLFYEAYILFLVFAFLI